MTRRSFWVLIGVAVMLALAVGGAVLLGSGMVRLTMTSPSAPAPTTLITRPSPAPTNQPLTPRPAAWAAAASMIEARTRHTATLLSDGKVLVAGGSDGESWLASAELFDPGSGAWTRTGTMNEAPMYPTATRLLDGTVLVIGFQKQGVRLRASAEVYDPGSGTWRPTGDPGWSITDGMTATLLPDGDVLGVLGTEAQIYDASTGSWHTTGPMIEHRTDHAAALLPDGKVLIVGGADSRTQQDGFSASAELYDPATESWSATGSLAEGRQYLTATLLVDGTVLVAGGLGELHEGTPELASSELYDAVSGTWAAKGDMNAPGFSGATFTLLLDGTVLAAGQAGAAELYDPVSGTWTITAGRNGTRLHCTATRLADGTVLVAGGDWSFDAVRNPVPVASVEAYEPVGGN